MRRCSNRLLWVRSAALAAALAAALVGACSPRVTAGPCDQPSPPPECAQACDPSGTGGNTCPAGFHCSPDGLCDAVCTATGGECGNGEVCTSDGRCVPGDGDAALGPDANCPDVQFTATRTIPTVQLLIDQSGSMTDPFGGTNRWQAVRTALVGPGGVVTDLADEVVFGATTYSGVSADNNGDGIQEGLAPCPALTATPRALNNLAAITGALAGNPIEDTPTGPSIDAVIADFAASPPMAGSPPIIVLATDGLPDTCQNADPRNASEQAAANAATVAAAQRAFTAGIRLFVLSVGNDVGNAHLQQMANAGAGQDPATGTAPFYLGDNPASLTAAFDAIIGGVLSCDLDLDGNVNPAQAASGTVTLNGTALTFGSEWELVDSNSIRLIGAACTTLQGATNPTVSASFPCGAVVD
ncbi:MAG: VWA domain-containing protein [Kofleriaceae bacterium]|jgi:hypothetical protein|nr:VWA domain-containing protein [Kofleriaceae bacterium]MBP6838969.1 VWA domain-containing protein [Kofleriaceae bacterium]